MRSKILAHLVVPLLAATAAVLALPAGNANAAVAPVTGGQSAFTIDNASLTTVAHAAVIAYPTSPAGGSVEFSAAADTAADTAADPVVRVTFPVTGGSADLAVLNANVTQGGGLHFVNFRNHKQADVSGLALQLSRFRFTALITGQTAAVPFVTLGTIRVDRVAGTITAADAKLTAAAAAALNTALGTTVFTEGLRVGSLSTGLTF